MEVSWKGEEDKVNSDGKREGVIYFNDESVDKSAISRLIKRYS